MGKLEVIFRVRLAHPLLPMYASQSPAIIQFRDTGNTVRLEPPRDVPQPAQPALEGFGQMTLRVERECTDEEGRDTSPRNADRLRINQDAARASWQLFEAIREAGLRRDNKVFMYPVVPSEDIRLNPLVRGCESTSKKGHEVLYTSKVVVSQDGKVMTITSKGKNPDGEPFDNVQVYDRQ